MPAQMTYTSLITDLQAYTERGQSTDTTVYAQLPNIINDAERAIIRELKLQGDIVALTSTMVQGTYVYAKPDRWRETVSINFGAGVDNENRKQLRSRSYEFCNATYPDRTTEGEPIFYADYDLNHWLFVPTPDDAYPFESVCYSMPPLLDGTNTTNFLTENLPDMLRFRCARDLFLLLRDAGKAALFGGLYDQTKGAAQQADSRKMVDRNATRSGP